MRVTSAYLKKWLQLEFCRLNIGLIVKKSYKTRLRQCEYECGAAHYILLAGVNNSPVDLTIYCFASRSELEDALNSGKKLKWRPRNREYINESEITYE